jgi:8-oxo-dGTP pyrophosphatase MutT (NUDIX family)
MTSPIYKENSHCSFCGQRFAPTSRWPRECGRCHHVSYRNPLPVVVVLVPVLNEHKLGLLLVQRAIAPHAGAWALPGGFIESGEDWRAAGAREVREEAGVKISPSSLAVRDLFSAPDDTLIIAAQSDPLSAAAMPPFLSNPEASARTVAHAPMQLAFPYHTQTLADFLTENGQGALA